MSEYLRMLKCESGSILLKVWSLIKVIESGSQPQSSQHQQQEQEGVLSFAYWYVH